MRKKLIALHWEWMKTGSLPEDGLCDTLEYTKYYKDLKNLFETAELYGQYWGADVGQQYNDSSELYKFRRYREYGPTRQSIVLLICAMHNEL